MRYDAGKKRTSKDNYNRTTPFNAHLPREKSSTFTLCKYCLKLIVIHVYQKQDDFAKGT